MMRGYVLQSGEIIPINNPHDCKNDADRILEEWDRICNELKIKHFLFGGTCLGIFRDGSYIKGDNDLDVGILCSNDDFTKFTNEMIKCGYASTHHYRIHHHFLKNNILLDVYNKFDGFVVFLESLDKVIYHGRAYGIPSPIFDYLEKHFGKDWRIPIDYETYIRTKRELYSWQD